MYTLQQKVKIMPREIICNECNTTLIVCSLCPIADTCEDKDSLDIGTSCPFCGAKIPDIQLLETKIPITEG